MLSRGGVRPCRKVGREGSLREASNEDMLRASETPLRWQKHGCDVLLGSRLGFALVASVSYLGPRVESTGLNAADATAALENVEATKAAMPRQVKCSQVDTAS